MKASNLQFKSNLYVLTSGHKNTQEFVSKVSDAKTLLQIHRRSSGILLDWQKKFAEQGMSCALAKRINEDHTAEVIDHHTHGIITENGEKVCVCKCQYEECPRFSECSSRDDFRRITLTYEPEIPSAKPVPKERDRFTYEEPPRAEKVTTYVQPIIQGHGSETVWHNYKGWKEEHGVRGHWRTLADGSKTWVREHSRGGEKLGYVHPDNIIGGNPQLDAQSAIAEPGYADTGEFEDSEFTPDFMIGDLVQLESAETIITAPIEERVLVNGGAGTGKTHTVIERIKHIFKNNLMQADKVYVLCFSRSAVKVIRKRLREEIDSGKLDYEANKIEIRTFDSFATWCLRTDESINLQYYDYEKRIERFIEEYLKAPQDLNDGIGYLIVDEIQDLVGQRAELVRCLLDETNCGFMLLGDQCQAIYDYQITDDKELNASRFFEWLDGRFGKELKRYELTKNYRQQTTLQTDIMPLRKAMLTDSIKQQKCKLKQIIGRYNMSDMSADDIIDCCSGERAILSWSNADAYTQSQRLYLRKNPVQHLLLGNSRKVTFTKEIAYLLSTYVERSLARRTFFELARVAEIDPTVAKQLWDGLQRLDSSQEGFVDLDKVRQHLLWESNVDDALISTNNSSVTVSTIHKAKGKEYDEVLVNLSEINTKAGKSDFAEIKVYYVALTRAKKEVIVKINRPSYDEKTVTGRHIKCGQGNVGGYNRVLKYELGLDGDIDMRSFVDRKLFGSDEAVRRNQDYIRYRVKCGDQLSIWLDGGIYKIYHNDRIIGSMNLSAFEKHWQFRPWWKKPYVHNLANYNRFEDIFVSDIITVVNKGVHANTAEPYSRSGLWLGVDFCGYSRPMEE